MQHDKANQNLEANLDVVLDRLRQGPTPEVHIGLSFCLSFMSFCQSHWLNWQFEPLICKFSLPPHFFFSVPEGFCIKRYA